MAVDDIIATAEPDAHVHLTGDRAKPRAAPMPILLLPDLLLLVCGQPAVHAEGACILVLR